MGEEYVLGHRAEELARLDGQAKMLEPATRLALQLAGIRPGMRVVDLGTGTGEVALLVAEAVGPEGSVVAVDRSPEGLAYAETKCADRGVTTIRFVEADVATYVPDGAVDAVAGPAGAVLPAGPGGDRPAAARLRWGRAGSTWRSSTTPRPVRSCTGRRRWSTRLAALMNAAFAAVGTPQTLGPHLAGDAARGGGCGRPEPRAPGLPGPGRPDRTGDAGGR